MNIEYESLAKKFINSNILQKKSFIKNTGRRTIPRYGYTNIEDMIQKYYSFNISDFNNTEIEFLKQSGFKVEVCPEKEYITVLLNQNMMIDDSPEILNKMDENISKKSFQNNILIYLFPILFLLSVFTFDNLIYCIIFPLFLLFPFIFNVVQSVSIEQNIDNRYKEILENSLINHFKKTIGK